MEDQEGTVGGEELREDVVEDGTNGEGRDAEWKCYRCGGANHFARVCPSTANSAEDPNALECHTCSGKGHVMRVCPNNPRGRRGCFRGGRGGYGPPVGACYVCGKLGHRAFQCFNRFGARGRGRGYAPRGGYRGRGRGGYGYGGLRGGVGTPGSRGVVCYNCSQVGHYARECPQSNAA